MNQIISLRKLIKTATVAVALGGAFSVTPSFAADTAAPAPMSVQAAATSQSLAQAQPQVQQKTRAEVYQELVAAEKSGELQREDATYAGN